MLSFIRKQTDLLRILRPHQWIKNLVVFSPLLAVGNDQFLQALYQGVEVFCIFSCAASFVYILNDVLDFQHDHFNPKKSYRPIAANKVSPLQISFVASGILFLLAILLWRAGNFLFVPVTIYILGNVIYSTLAKKVIFLDLLLIAVFFHLRSYTGALNIQIELSYLHYSVGFFFYLGLITLKRYIEISNNPRDVPGRSYNQSHLAVVSIIGLLCTLTAIVLLGRYLSVSEITNVYRQPALLLFLVPLFIGEVVLLIYKARCKKLSEDLTMLLLNDRASQIFFVSVMITIILSR